MQSEAERDKILENSLAITAADQGCPIQRSYDFWLASLRDDPNRSNVARDVSQEVSAEQEKESWANHLYWTNL
jgi:hypothetical protein